MIVPLQTIPLKHPRQGHTAERIVAKINEVMTSALGDDWRSKVHCAVTDGAKNVTAASMQVGLSRRCLQHGLQLLLKYFCATQRDIASAMACCNYLAKLSGLSQKFATHVGRIPAGVVTRWNSFIRSAFAVYQAADQIRSYVNSRHCYGKAEAALRARLRFLDEKRGFQVLHDMIVVLKPLMDITIDEEGELYITASAVVPRLTTAKQRIDLIIANAERGDDSNGLILNTDRVKGWKPLFNDLWDKYLDEFCFDDVFLMATLLDARFGAAALSSEQLIAAGAALRVRLTNEYSRREADRAVAQRVLDEAAVAQGGAAGVNADGSDAVVHEQVSNGRVAGVEYSGRSVHASLALLGLAAEGPMAMSLPARTYRGVEDELRALVGLPKMQMAKDPMTIFSDRNHNLQLARVVALDVLSVPAGEAPSERIFSIASRVIGFDRAKMSAKYVALCTFVKKNRRALHHK